MDRITPSQWEHRARSFKVQQITRALDRAFLRNGYDTRENPQEFGAALAEMTPAFWNEFCLFYGIRKPSETTRALVIAGYMALKPRPKRVLETTGEELPVSEVA